jgi:pseudaminic acid cytidylyltransferase
MLVNNQLDAVFPGVRFSSPILRSYKKLESGKLEMNWPEYRNKRTQDIDASFYDSGQFYFFDIKNYLLSNDIITDNCGGFEISELESQDIDNETDWLIAEMKYQLTIKQKKYRLKWSPTVGLSIKDHKCISVVLDFSLYDLAE